MNVTGIVWFAVGSVALVACSSFGADAPPTPIADAGVDVSNDAAGVDGDAGVADAAPSYVDSGFAIGANVTPTGDFTATASSGCGGPFSTFQASATESQFAGDHDGSGNYCNVCSQVPTDAKVRGFALSIEPLQAQATPGARFHVSAYVRTTAIFAKINFHARTWDGVTPTSATEDAPDITLPEPDTDWHRIEADLTVPPRTTTSAELDVYLEIDLASGQSGDLQCLNVDDFTVVAE